jgi:hypothetical protein
MHSTAAPTRRGRKPSIPSVQQVDQPDARGPSLSARSVGHAGSAGSARLVPASGRRLCITLGTHNRPASSVQFIADREVEEVASDCERLRLKSRD